MFNLPQNLTGLFCYEIVINRKNIKIMKRRLLMKYDYIQHTINGVPLDVYVSSDYQSVWLSPIDMSCLFAVDLEDIEEYIDKMFEMGIASKEKEYDEEEGLYSFNVVVLVGANFKSNNLKPFIDWVMKLLKANKTLKNFGNDKLAYLINSVINLDNRLNDLCEKEV